MVDFAKRLADDKQVYAVVDYETFCEAELGNKKKGQKPGVGAYEYCAHPSAEILCVAWRVGTLKELAESTEEDTQLWAPKSEWCPKGVGHSITFTRMLLDPDIILVAHNAFFEQCVTKLILPKYVSVATAREISGIEIGRWRCTMAMSYAQSLPGGLGPVSKALQLDHEKDEEGKKILLKWCKPRKPTKKDPSLRHKDPAEFNRLLQYCKTDIAAEVDLFCTLPQLSPGEQHIWEIDQKINMRGFFVDRPLISRVMETLEIKGRMLLDRAQKITEGKIQTMGQRDKILDFLAENGVYLENIKKKTVADAVPNIEGVALELLEIRQSLGLTSLAKLPSLFHFSSSDGRVRGTFAYHSASTGRFAGRGPQPQNLAKPDPRLARVIGDSPKHKISIENFMDELSSMGMNQVELIYGDYFTVAASALRHLIMAAPGKIFRCRDYSNIEARVILWLAGETEALEKLGSGYPVYEEMGGFIFGKTLEEVLELVKAEGKDIFIRFVGKAVILGAGFQMGWARFQQQCKDAGVDIPDEDAKKAIQGWRDRHPRAVQFWRNLEKAAIGAVQNPGRAFHVGRLKYVMEDAWLYCYLPSGRKMAYFRPSVRFEMNTFGEKQAKLYYWGVHPQKGILVEESTYGGKLAENATQAVARDITVTALSDLEAEGYSVVLHAHDEIVTEDDPEDESLPEAKIISIMSRVPKWALGLPIATEGWEGIRYKK